MQWLTRCDVSSERLSHVEKRPLTVDVFAHPISNELYLNDGFFDNVAPSPTAESAKPQETPQPMQVSVDNESSTPPRPTADSPELTKLKVYKDSSLEFNSFPDMNMDVDLQEMDSRPPKKQGKKPPPKKEEKKPPPKKRQRPRRRNSLQSRERVRRRHLASAEHRPERLIPEFK
jgi:hypothetical protein